MDWLDLFIGILGLIGGIFGTLSVQKKVTQKNTNGNNIINEGFSSKEVAEIMISIKELSDDQIKQVKDALLEEFKNRPRIFRGKEFPNNPQVGDVLIKVIESDNKD